MMSFYKSRFANATIIHKGVEQMDKQAFAERLTALRISAGVSARDMSLSIGQSPSYIHSIENGSSFPSMTCFFYICDYLHITPQEFFAEDVEEPVWLQDVMNAAKRLNREQLQHLTAIMRDMAGRRSDK